MKFRLFSLLFLFITTLIAQEQNFDRYLSELENEFGIMQIRPDSLKSVNSIILDTREKEEYEISHIPDAIYTGYSDFNIDSLATLNKDTTIVVYCSVGYRSSKIAQQLIEAGFKDVRNLYGGIFNWVNQNQEIIKDGIVTDSIHTYSEKWGRYITNKNMLKIP